MSSWVELFMVLIVLMNFMFVSSSRLSVCIQVVSIQGIIVGLLPFLIKTHPLALDNIIFCAANVTLKGFIFPWLLFSALREANVRREVEPSIGYLLSMILCIGAFLLSTWLTSRLPLPSMIISPWIVPVSFSTILTGLLIIVSRFKALIQVLGYLVIENGIYIFGMSLLVDQELLVELAILLDIFVAVFVMGIAIFHISREFDHMDTQHLSQLKDWVSPGERKI